MAIHAEYILGLDSRYAKAVVPWGAITSQREEFIEDQFLPPDFEMRRDPSKMNKTQIVQLLQYWHGRQNNRRVRVPFQFKAYKDRSTGEIVGCDRKGKGKVRQTRTSSKKSGGGRAVRREEEDKEISDLGGESEPTPKDSEPDTKTDSDDALSPARPKSKRKGKGVDNGNASARDKPMVRADKGKNKAPIRQEQRMSSDSDSDTDSNAHSDADNNRPKSHAAKSSDPYVKPEEVRKRRLQAMRESALARAKKKFLADMEKERSSAEGEHESGGVAGPSKGRGNKRRADTDDDGARKKAKGKEVKPESSPRKIVTRSRGQAEFEGLVGNQRSRKFN